MSNHTPTAPEPPAWLAQETRYLRRVIRVCDTGAGRADLRTGARPGGLDAPWRMMPHLVRHLPTYHADHDAYLTIAAWYATYGPRREHGADLPPAWEPDQGNIGWSTALAIRRDELTERTAVMRLEAITRQHDPEAMRRTLRPLVSTLCGMRVPISWPLLLRDLAGWRTWPRDITRRWMYAMYDPDHHTIPATTTTPTEEG